MLVLLLSHSLLHFLTVEKYGWLVDGAADDRIKTFIAEEHSFDEYAEVISCIIYKYTWLLFCNIHQVKCHDSYLNYPSLVEKQLYFFSTNHFLTSI